MNGPPVDIDSEEAAADWLYSLAPDAFVDNRNQLVKQLRADGRRDLAALVASLRRPTVIAGELNRVLRADPARLEALIDAAVAIRDGHQDMLDGEMVDIAALQREHRQAAIDLSERADRNQTEIHAILASASLDDSIHDRLRAASFAEAPAPQTGFDLLTPTATVTSLTEARARRDARTAAATQKKAEAPSGSAKAPSDPSAKPPAGERTRARAPRTKAPTRKRRSVKKRISRAEAEAELQAASKAQVLADRRLDAALKTQAKAAERVTKLESQLNAAQEHLGEAETKRAAAEAATTRAQERLDAAQVVLRDLDTDQ